MKINNIEYDCREYSSIEGFYNYLKQFDYLYDIIINTKIDFSFFDTLIIFKGVPSGGYSVETALAIYALELTENAMNKHFLQVDKATYDNFYDTLKRIYFDYLFCEFIQYIEAKDCA